MTLTNLPDSILIRLIGLLSFKDILTLGQVDPALRTFVFGHPEIWSSEVLFPPGDKSITDTFIKRTVPQITRHYGIQELRMVDLPLTWQGYFWIFDQFAHSVDTIQIRAPVKVLSELTFHLCIFAGNLAMLQHTNRIPITFRQYAVDPTEHTQALEATNYLGHQSLHKLQTSLPLLTLDDPPFERLSRFDLTSIDDTDNYGSSTIQNVYSLASFLAGQSLTSPHVLWPRKRMREDNAPLSPVAKHLHLDESASPLHSYRSYETPASSS
ncbi:uncharacterized protein BYT42DRAFT_579452 [Radiomyces spectabilis]|uniref:uncharacterized protein n=1 Tax=Radiomyces spectabilis TaxID=64574 RepID=UPI00221E8113|nr:uncharacterized protein BYT42DRAFT_579452 [Radiomyces spectabilis]KAI8373173.1 hypothetical protein BYT42DRAFT_579452 [Radiomyces spectabilis]